MIAIHRFHARYTLAPGATGEQKRLQRILADVLDSGLEAALRRRGLDTGGELCLREVSALARLNLGQSDSTLAATVALAMADAIEAGAEKAGANVVHYGSRAHALIDLASASLGGDFTRAWAWRRLGLWSAASTVSTADAVRLVLRALTAEPRSATAAVTHVARDPARFDSLLQLVTPAQWSTLARAVIQEVGAGADALLPPVDGPLPIATARRLAERSAIARAAAASGRIDRRSDSPRRALAALAICEVEPVLMRTPPESARALIHAVAESVVELSERPQASTPDRSWRGAVRPDGDVQREALPSPESPTTLARTGDTSPASSPSRSGRPGRLVEPAHGADPLPAIRRRAHTRFGGLLYLVNVASRIGLAERILQDDRLAGRAPRWSLHQLALSLVAVPDSDPAALAFAGLLPGSEPPGSDQPVASDLEAAAISEMRGELLLALRALLDRAVDAEPALIDVVCRRPAEIVADPGWLEARFSLDDVSTEIRAAGLDADPGWVPWLGLVIKFVYA